MTVNRFVIVLKDPNHMGSCRSVSPVPLLVAVVALLVVPWLVLASNVAVPRQTSAFMVLYIGVCLGGVGLLKLGLINDRLHGLSNR
jgi:hypothetical protein